MSINNILQALTRTLPVSAVERQEAQKGAADFGDILDENKGDVATNDGPPAGGKRAGHIRPAEQHGRMIAQIRLDERDIERVESETPSQAPEVAMQPAAEESPPLMNFPHAGRTLTEEQEDATLPDGHDIQPDRAVALFLPSTKPAEPADSGPVKPDLPDTGRAERKANIDAGTAQFTDVETSSDPGAWEKTVSPGETAERPVSQPRGQQGREEPAQRVTVVATQSFAAPVNASINPTIAGVAEALAGDEGLKQAVVATSSYGAAQQRTMGAAHSLRIELHPAELGMISARLLLAGDQLSVEIKPDTHEGWQRLSSDSETIARAMRDLGFEISRVTILPPSGTATPAPRADAGGFASREGSSFQSGGSGHESGSQGERHASGDNARENRQPVRSSSSAAANGGRGLYI